MLCCEQISERVFMNIRHPIKNRLPGLFLPLVLLCFALCALYAGEARAEGAAGAAAAKDKTMKTMPPLTPEEERIIIHKGTEYPGTGKYLGNKAKGTYVCRACGSPLYRSEDKFESGCGWPSFDDEIPGKVKRSTDADGRRVEITCANCGGHLGHVFTGERFTDKNTRHCVNSISMHFIPEGEKLPEAAGTAQDQKPGPATAVFGGGCFWGVEDIFSRTPGVLDAVSGYSGGSTVDPTYDDVCSGRTGHAEVVRVTYDPSEISFEALARLFFELHDPTQLNRQGPDRGSQYRSILFYNNDEEKRVAQELVTLLINKGYDVVTELVPAAPFYPAEEYHQDFIRKHPGRPCHLPVKRFD